MIPPASSVPATATRTTGFSLSPGGLLLPYHVGVLASLKDGGYLTDHTPIAGASAGAIAVAGFGCGIKPEATLESTIRLADAAKAKGGARGNLMPLLKEELAEVITDESLQILKERPGMTGIAYRELFPQNQPILATEFQSPEDLIRAVCCSSAFPFFTTNYPVTVEWRKKGSLLIPQVAVDGFFNVPRSRFGCPCLKDHTDRTITVSVFPHDAIGLTDSEEHDRISPKQEETNPNEQLLQLLKLATETASQQEYYQLYEQGLADGEYWVQKERELEKLQQEQQERDLLLLSQEQRQLDLN